MTFRKPWEPSAGAVPTPGAWHSLCRSAGDRGGHKLQVGAARTEHGAPPSLESQCGSTLGWLPAQGVRAPSLPSRALLRGPGSPCGPAQPGGVDVRDCGCPTWPPHGSLVISPCVLAQFPPPPRARELLSCFILGRKSEVVLFFPLLPAQAVGTVP